MPPRRSSKTDSTQIALTAAMRVVVLHGPEPVLIREKLDELRAALEAEHGPIEPKVFDGKTVMLADVLDELRTLSLMASHSLVIVDDADQFVKEERGYREAITRYVQNPCDSGTLVLRSGVWHKGNLDKSIAKVGAVIKLDPLSPRDAAAWLTRRARDVHDRKLEPAAATALIERVGSSLGLLDSELGKLAVTVGKGEAITADIVTQLVGRGSDAQAWSVQEALLRTLATGSARDAIEKARELVDLAREHEVLVLYAAGDLARKLYQATLMIEQRQNDFGICRALKVWPAERQQAFMAVARQLGRARAAELFDQVVSADRRSKSGWGDAVRNLEGFCVQAADLVR